MKKIFIATGIIAIAFSACKTTKPTETTSTKTPVDCSTMTITYEADIKPILENHCIKCHGDAGGLDFSKMADITKSAKNGELLGTIKWEHGFPKMPARAAKLDDATIAKVECWINGGMK